MRINWCLALALTVLLPAGVQGAVREDADPGLREAGVRQETKEQGTEQGPEETTTEAATETAEEKPEPEQTSNPNAPPEEVFLPTEEISEDYPAPFPVDI